jgi:cysteine desulfurase
MSRTEATIYLDNNATTRVAPEVVEAMMPFFSERYGNPSSMHRFGGSVRKTIDTAREQVASLLNAGPGEILFTSCGTEGSNLAIKGFCDMRGNTAKLITSTVEHPAVGNTCLYCKKKGAALSEIGVDPLGMLSVHDLISSKIDTDTLATFMWANNETGVIFPIARIAEHVKEKGGYMHTDAVQAAGKIAIDVQKTPVDMLNISGHKIHAPKGVGALYVRAGTRLTPLLHGGHQEGGMRGGTENVAYIAALGKACELAASRMETESVRLKNMRDRLERELMARCQGSKLNGDPLMRLPNTLNISFEFIEGESILLLLDEKGIAASSGSACTSGSLEPSHVMRAMGIPYTFAHSSTRFSLSGETTDAEIDAVIAAMPGIVDKLRGISPYVS